MDIWRKETTFSVFVCFDNEDSKVERSTSLVREYGMNWN